MPRVAAITGIGGQDGALLSELLLDDGDEVFGIVRRPPADYAGNLANVTGRVVLLQADLLDTAALAALLREIRPSEVYNLAAPSFVPRSWDEPVLTAEIAALGATSLLEAVRNTDPTVHVYQASSSEIFGQPLESPQTEATPLAPLTPYGISKAYAHFIAGAYRRRYGMFVSCGILYNHESPLRPVEFLPRKVARAAAAISLGIESQLVLGDLSAQRDWGSAKDYVRAMRAMLRHHESGDFVVATGEVHTVEELVECAFRTVGLEWRNHVTTDSQLYRGSAEHHRLVGDASKATRELGWAPSVTFEELIRSLVEADVARARTTRGERPTADRRCGA